MDKINIFIFNYNTPRLVDACIRSINKHMNNANITIIDNSNKLPIFICNYNTINKSYNKDLEEQKFIEINKEYL